MYYGKTLKHNLPAKNWFSLNFQTSSQKECRRPFLKGTILLNPLMGLLL